uniref:Uncharacterized protein n=1 Tax=Nelumbo nucifera TaxID=4432 RepID=A0A822YQ51_NELNU|nr:TPA_asm: hypothetical protein HUJ06_012330 [Nelumbo nucifera]
MFMMNNLQVDKRIGVGGDPPSQLSQTTHSGTDWNWRLVVDASSFFLVEATGDSEADCDPIGTTAGNEFSTVDDDDAESCTSDSCSSEFINVFSISDSGAMALLFMGWDRIMVEMMINVLENGAEGKQERRLWSGAHHGRWFN